jgi:hypothetical protein
MSLSSPTLEREDVFCFILEFRVSAMCLPLRKLEEKDGDLKAEVVFNVTYWCIYTRLFKRLSELEGFETLHLSYHRMYAKLYLKCSKEK